MCSRGKALGGEATPSRPFIDVWSSGGPKCCIGVNDGGSLAGNDSSDASSTRSHCKLDWLTIVGEFLSAWVAMTRHLTTLGRLMRGAI